LKLPTLRLVDAPGRLPADAIAAALARPGVHQVVAGKLPPGNGIAPYHERSALKSGHLEVFSPDDGLFMSAVHGEMESTQVFDYDTSEDLFMMRASLSTAVLYEAIGSGVWEFRRPGVVVVHIPRGVRLRITVQGGQRHHGINMLLRPSYLTEQCGIPVELLPEVLQPGRERGKTHGTLASLPITREIAALVRDLLQSSLTGGLRLLQLQARALELMALVIDAVREQPTLVGPRAARRHDVEIVHQAREILTRQFVDPPTIQALAQRLGTNKHRLNQLFRLAHGTTIQAYCVQRKMMQAQVLLIEGQLNICQVADAVGYQHQSSFTAAFRDYIGVSPKEYAKSRAATNFKLKPTPIS